MKWVSIIGMIVLIGYILFASAAPELNLPVNLIVFVVLFVFIGMFSDYRRKNTNKKKIKKDGYKKLSKF